MTEQMFPDGLRIKTDDLGQCLKVCIDSSLYSQVAVFKTAYWYTNDYYLFLDRPSAGSQEIRVEFRHKDISNRAPLKSVGAEFLNRLIDQQVRQDVLKETGAVREQLIKKAFFEGASHLDPDNLVSDESHLPIAGQDYHDDPLTIGRETGAK